ncbi:unnamed protein product [Fusarium venenatum]|uniref:CENP-V/GFA domain-containing protein n=1 Tax=Fusarium venenatum TaxID=56646 RepID=A0A2L2T2V5_9HYPO|nr:LOW QUALITY PROTEIN: uncharacterized protein FVRRES_00341 [Fusarium venenatum]CEI63829.1 unnamed protein product [Fusarium venenatum]
MPSYTGKCVCGNVKYSVSLDSPDDARTSLCHCGSCKRAFGTNFGLTTKVALEGFRYDEGKPKSFKQENGVIREFCDNCGAFICEYGCWLDHVTSVLRVSQEQAADKFRYIMWGTFDDPDKFPPKGEFFCKYRAGWMPEVPDLFHKNEIKE